MFSQQFLFFDIEESNVEAKTAMQPQCSCVVYSGILLTWDPLRGVEGLGVENAQQDWEEEERKACGPRNQ